MLQKQAARSGAADCRPSGVLRNTVLQRRERARFTYDGAVFEVKKGNSGIGLIDTERRLECNGLEQCRGISERLESN
jgi:hypothetical protein